MSNVRLLTTAETAKVLDRSTTWVVRKARSGELPYVQKLGGIRGGYLFDASVIALVARQQARGAA